MGCTSSKLDDLPAVALCRDRCNFLDEAIKQRYALSQSHLAYLHSLKSIGHSLHAFLDAHDVVLHIPVKKSSSSEPPPVHSPAGSNSGSHINFRSDTEDEDDDDDSDFEHHDSPLHTEVGQIHYMGNDQNELSSFPSTGYVHMNYMKKQTTPSVVYQQRPFSPETYRVGESSSSASNYGYFGFPNNGDSGYSNYGYYGSSSMPPPPEVKQPPPPPSPPRSSPWDFLNLFENYDRSYAAVYTPSRDSKELREEEGIPELEEEGEVVKEVHGDQKFVGGSNLKGKVVEEGGGIGKGDEEREMDGSSGYRSGSGPSGSMEPDHDGEEYEVHVVDKKIVEGEGKGEDRATGLRDVSDVVTDIKDQFEQAAESGNEIAKLLEVGRIPHNRRYRASKMLHVASPSLSMVSSQPSTSQSTESASSTDHSGPAYLEIEQDLAMRAKNLSATLQKLLLWEKKLHNEVKAEEKMRVAHDRKRQKLKRLDERGAEAPKVDSTRTLVRSLSTKIKIAIQVVDKISATINKIRDEELWPQLNELIKGLSKMYKCMLQCHRAQCQAIRESRSLGNMGSGKMLSDEHLEATSQLEHDLINWTVQFSSWISAQKNYVRALNGWLLKCLLYEPEETPDGIAPFSPGRIGAPPIFVICNQWSEALKEISEKEVLESMRLFADGVLQMWDQDKLEMRQRLMANKDLERRVRSLDRKDQKIQKGMQALDKKIVMASGDSYSVSVPVYQSDTSTNSIQASLLRIFEAMERFTEKSTKAYEALIQRSEEEVLRPRV